MGKENEAMHFSKLGLEEAKEQNIHDYDAEFNFVIDRIV